MLIVNQIFQFIYDHCTGPDENKSSNQRKFLGGVRDLLTKTTLRERTIDELWALSWDKPIWANQPANVGGKVVVRCVQSKIFARYKEIPSFSPENVKILEGLRDPKEKLIRINRLASDFEQIYNEYISALLHITNIAHSAGRELNSFNCSTLEIRKIIGAPNPNGVMARRLYGRLVQIKGFGVATALHTMVDYGFPVCKPDLWIIRLTQAYSEMVENGDKDSLLKTIRAQCPNFDITLLSQKYIEAHPEFTFAVIDYLVENHLNVEAPYLKDEGIRLDLNFNAHRFADLIVSKFGMSAEENMGIVVPPSQLLDKHSKSQDEALIKKYPQLSDLATNAEEIRRADAERKDVKAAKGVKAAKKMDKTIRFAAKPINKSYLLHPPIVVYRAALKSVMAQRNFDHVIQEMQKRKISLKDIEFRMIRTPADRFSEIIF